MNKTPLKKFILYSLKWQMGTPVMILVLLLLPINNIIIKTILSNILGAVLFYKIDLWIFTRDKYKGSD